MTEVSTVSLQLFYLIHLYSWVISYWQACILQSRVSRNLLFLVS